MDRDLEIKIDCSSKIIFMPKSRNRWSWWWCTLIYIMKTMRKRKVSSSLQRAQEQETNCLLTPARLQFGVFWFLHFSPLYLLHGLHQWVLSFLCIFAMITIQPTAPLFDSVYLLLTVQPSIRRGHQDIVGGRSSQKDLWGSCSNEDWGFVQILLGRCGPYCRQCLYPQWQRHYVGALSNHRFVPLQFSPL